MTGAARRRVLVLDDDPDILALIAARLKGEPIQLVECSELEAAETLLDHMQFGVLVVDLEVSELGGLEGVRLIRHAVANFPETRILVFTGHLTTHAHRLATALGVTDTLEKPADLDELVKLVRSLTTDPFSAGAQENPFQLTVIEPLEEVVAAKNITSVFQPIFRLARNGSPPKLFGVEALSRGPSGSLLQNPMILFDYAVRKELTFETDMLCIDRALTASTALPKGGRLFINTHPRALSHPGFVAALADLLETHRVPRDQVVLELTEQAAIVDSKALAEILDQMRMRGVQIALDDFGEGSSNLHLVHDLRPEFLKITGRFCDGLETTPARQALVKSAVELSQDLGMRTVMERVETDEQLDILATLGIEFGQGFHLGRPQLAEQLAAAWPSGIDQDAKNPSAEIGDE